MTFERAAGFDIPTTKFERVLIRHITECYKEMDRLNGSLPASMDALKAALEEQVTGAEWRCDNEPENWNGADDEALERAKAALAALPEISVSEIVTEAVNRAVRQTLWAQGHAFPGVEIRTAQIVDVYKLCEIPTAKVKHG